MGQPVLYVTERCVMRLGQQGLELIEIAPGIDLERDILAQMDFKPLIPDTPRLMDERIFRPDAMNLQTDLLTLRLQDRLSYDAAENLFFVNFEGLAVKSRDDIEKIRLAVEQILAPVSQKVDTIVNYDNFYILPELVDSYTAMVKALVERFYAGVTRYTTSTFLRMKLGDALKKRNVAPHIYESRSEAQRVLKNS